MNLEELLYENAPLARDAMLAALPAPEECRHEFSPAFQRKMRALLRRQAHPLRHRVLRSAAAVFLAAIVGSAAWLAVDVRARTAFFQWVEEFYETHIVYRFQGVPAEEEAAGVYRPAWVPEGYEAIDVWEQPNNVMVLYENEDGSYMNFFYGPIQEGVAQVVNDSDIARKEPVDIHGVPGEFYLAADPAVSNTLIWSDEDIGMSFTISGFLEKEDMLHMAESVFSSDPTNQKN